MKAPFQNTIFCLSLFFSGSTLAQDAATINTTELISNTKRVVDDLKAKVMNFEGLDDKEMAYFEGKFNELSTDTDKISQIFKNVNVENISGYFNVERGSFKTQLMKLAALLGIDAVQFKNVSECMDWNIDSAFKLNISDVKTALNAFIDEMPLSYQYLERDNSLTVNGLESSQQCENK